MKDLDLGKHLNLYKWSFHPDHPTLAFVGLQRAIGSIIPVCELQSRWVAQIFSGAKKLPARPIMDAWMGRYREAKSDSNTSTMKHDNGMVEMMEALAEEVGCKPSMIMHPFNALTLLQGGCYPAQYRIDGPDSQPDAMERVMYYNANPMFKVPAACEILDTADAPWQPP